MRNISDKLLDYLKGNMPADEKAMFEQQLSASTYKDEFENLRDLWLKLQALPEIEPGENVAARFYAMLETYKAGQQQAQQKFKLKSTFNRWLERWWPQQPVWQLSFSLTLLLCGLFLGYFFKGPVNNGDIDLLRNEVAGLRQMVATSLLQSQSASERLRGVNYSYAGGERPDDKTLQALLNTLNYDANLNVRLAAVDALALYYERELIRQGVVESLKRQTSPLLQVALIDLLVAREERRSLDALNSLKQNKMFDQAVRRRASKAIEQLK